MSRTILAEGKPSGVAVARHIAFASSILSCLVASSNQALNWPKGSLATRSLVSKVSSLAMYGFLIPPMSTAIPLQGTLLREPPSLATRLMARPGGCHHGTGDGVSRL